jgi:excisionase family DNA binding protein
VAEHAEQGVVDLREVPAVSDRLLTPAHAAAALGVAPRTVARWSDAGRLGAVRTPGGHRRYRAEDVIDLRERS